MAKLAAYRAKRDFAATPEPAGDAEGSDEFAFVVQKHDATRLHYDLRLELDGVMKSWAVAKGPSLVPGEKRLAVHVEDHPVAYNGFEGTIPKGQYGGGTVLLWDRGRWRPETDPHKGYAKGHLNFSLEGEKLAGAWHLVRMRRKPREKQEAWLLIKSEDEAARHDGEPDILDEKPLSVASGRDMEAIASDPDGAVWQSDQGLAADKRAEAAGQPAAGRPRRTSKSAPRSSAPRSSAPADDRTPKPTAARGTAKSPRSRPRAAGRPDEAVSKPDPLTQGGRKAPMPKEIEPCLATLVSQVPEGKSWLHEIKWDGYRLLAFKSKGRTRLATRRGHDWTERFPAIAEAVGALAVDDIVLDGEAVIEDANGVSSFSALQNALSDEHGGAARDAVLIAFDLLYLNGFDLRENPLDTRKARLSSLVPAGATGALRFGEHIEGDGPAMVRSACSMGLEGVISKRRDRPYRSGRGADWVKIKCTERQEFVIVGFTRSTATPRAVGSIALAYHEDGALRLAGRSGTGFSAQSAREIWTQLDALRRVTPPLKTRPSAEERRGIAWVEPKLVAEIEFRGWTGDGHLRHAAFKGLREDKSPAEVVRERPAGEQAGPKSGERPAASRAQPRLGTAEVAGIVLTHPDRVLWNAGGVTKLGLAEFYEAMAGWLLPQVAHRPLSLVRCPNGAEKGCFFQKHSWAGLGDDIRRETVRDGGGEEEVLFVDDIRGVISLVQASVLEIHPWGSRIDDVERADRITIDLDPGDGTAFTDVIAAARDVRERLSTLGLESFVKTTGGKGLHVVVPLTGPAAWVDVKAFAKSIADGMAGDAPGRYIAKASKSARRGLIYVDYLRNGRGATAVAAYSTRARDGAPVAVPLAWDELTPSLKPDHFTLANLHARMAGLRSDPWEELDKARQRLPDAVRTQHRPRRTPGRAGPG